MNHQLGMKCIVSGKVQGVWYRASAKKEADALGVTGWACNLDNGCVEVLAFGSMEQLNVFFECLKKGSPSSQVEQVSREDVAFEVWEDFSVK